ncbi:MAG TPA: hypothetical protein GX509_08045 [Firmicutes bacterium]|nr:hypothetical protein [Bacillota bacterium]HHY98673.1 hypothetical protein [Bacillota bacterium]
MISRRRERIRHSEPSLRFQYNRQFQSRANRIIFFTIIGSAAIIAFLTKAAMR